MLRRASIFDRYARRRGFTFVEMVIGMVVMAMVMGALAAVLSAVAQGWKQSGTVQASTSITSLSHLRLQRDVKPVHLIGAVRTGNTSGQNAAALLWKADANYDWQVQFSEMALLEYHPSTDATDPNTLRLYQVTWPTGWTPAQQQAADTTLSSTDQIYQDSQIDLFKTLQYVSYVVLARDVTACTINKNDSASTTRPSLDYKITITRGTTSETDLGTVAVRSPSTLPVSQR